MLKEMVMALKDRSYFFDGGLRFECTQCGSCCTGEPGIVFVSVEELEPIARYLTIPRQVMIEHCLYPFQDGFSIREDEDGRCIFYENGCAIYPVRPVQCRTFPFWFQNLGTMEAWDEVCLGCPGIGKGRLYTREEIFEAMDASFHGYLRAINQSLEKG